MKRSRKFRKDEIYRYDATHLNLKNHHNSNQHNHSMSSYRTEREKTNDLNSFSFSDQAKVNKKFTNYFIFFHKNDCFT